MNHIYLAGESITVEDLAELTGVSTATLQEKLSDGETPESLIRSAVVEHLMLEELRAEFGFVSKPPPWAQVSSATPTLPRSPLVLLVSEEERKAIERAAGVMGLSVERWARYTLTKAATSRLR